MHTGAFTDTHAHRELLKAIFGYSDRDPDEVVREIEAKRDGKSGGSGRSAPKIGAPIPQHKQDQLAELLASAAKAREAQAMFAAEPAPKPRRRRKPSPPPDEG